MAEHTFDPTKPVQTRDGREVKIFSTTVKNDIGSIVGIVIQHDGHENHLAWMSDGRIFEHLTSHPNGVPGDLVNVSPIPKGLRCFAETKALVEDVPANETIFNLDDLTDYLDKEGLVVVPWDPKQEMVDAMVAAFNKDRASWDLVWQAAITAWEEEPDTPVLANKEPET